MIVPNTRGGKSIASQEPTCQKFLRFDTVIKYILIILNTIPLKLKY